MSSQTRGEEFLDVYTRIENHFRARLGRGPDEGFTRMARDYVERYKLPRPYLDALRAFADLRNAISHSNYSGGRPIADPTPEVIADIRELWRKIEKPTTALHVLGRQKVLRVAADDPIRTVLHLVVQHDYSQFPVLHDGAWRLITTNAIARWLAHQFETDDGLAMEGTVADVLGCGEAQDQAVYAPSDVTAARAIYLLSRPLNGGIRPTALLITGTGKPTEQPLAVVVDEDLHALHAAL